MKKYQQEYNTPYQLKFPIEIEKIIDEQFIDAVFITNPIFSTGLEISNTIFEKIFKFKSDHK